MYNIYSALKLSKTTTIVVVFQERLSTPTYNYAIRVVSQYLTRVKLKRVFFPHIFCQARSPDSGFA